MAFHKNGAECVFASEWNDYSQKNFTKQISLINIIMKKKRRSEVDTRTDNSCFQFILQNSFSVIRLLRVIPEIIKISKIMDEV